jgi:hypothetical protein
MHSTISTLEAMRMSVLATNAQHVQTEPINSGIMPCQTHRSPPPPPPPSLPPRGVKPHSPVSRAGETVQRPTVHTFRETKRTKKVTKLKESSRG